MERERVREGIDQPDHGRGQVAGAPVYTLRGATSEHGMNGWRGIAASAVSLLLAGCASPPPDATPPEVGTPRGLTFYDLEVHAPNEGSRVNSSVPWLEVRGRTGTAELFESDVVLAIDLSNTTLLSSGIDLDEDGVTGEDRGYSPERRYGRSPRRWTTDRHDTIVLAEIEAARAIVAGLAPRRNRIGLVTYVGSARQRVPVGSPETSSAAIERLRPIEDWTGTNVAAALRRSQRMLEHPSLVTHPRRDRVILLFSDGQPSVPQSRFYASAAAWRAAADVAASGTRIYVLAFGELEPKNLEFVNRMASAASGVLVPVTDPRSLLQDLPPVALAPQSLVIANRTLDQPARAVRADRQGHFSGYVPLAEGENEIEVTAVLANGRSVVARRTVFYAPAAEPTEAERREAARLLLRLRDRTEALEKTKVQP